MGISDQLIRAAHDGDEAALSALLTAAQPDIRRYARRTCARSADVEDAVQETLWAVHRRLGSLRTITSFSVWMLTIVRRECLRLAKRYGVPAGATESLQLEDEMITERPEHELRLDLARAIHSLPDHYRAVLVLRDLEEETIEDIATKLSLTREAVKGRLHRARFLIREYLEE